jgi:hypothetical protein
MAEKVKNMLKNNVVLCVLLLAAIGLTSIVFAADFKIKEGQIKKAVVFGRWDADDSDANEFDSDTTYQAMSDGFVIAFADTGEVIDGFSDWNNPPENRRARNHDATSLVSITMPVRKNEYWKVTGACTIYWIPIGDGVCVKQ